MSPNTELRSGEPKAFAFFYLVILEHLVIQGLLSHQPLQVSVLDFQGFQAVHRLPGHALVFLLPARDGLLITP